MPAPDTTRPLSRGQRSRSHPASGGVQEAPLPRNRQPGNPQLACIFFWCRQRVCGSSAGSTYYCMHGSALCSMVCGRPCQRLYGDKHAPMMEGCEACLASQHLSNHPRSNPSSRSSRDGGSLAPCGGGPWLDEPLQGSKTKRWISSCLWPTGDAVCSVFFSPFCQFSERLVTHLRRISGRGHGGERGRKMTARPGVGRVSAPAVRGLRARAWTARGRHGPVISSTLLVIAAMAMC